METVSMAMNEVSEAQKAIQGLADKSGWKISGSGNGYAWDAVRERARDMGYEARDLSYPSDFWDLLAGFGGASGVPGLLQELCTALDWYEVVPGCGPLDEGYVCHLLRRDGFLEVLRADALDECMGAE